MEIWTVHQAAERIAPGSSDGSLAGGGHPLWEHEGALAAVGYFAAALTVVPRLAFGRLAPRVAREARARGEYGELQDYRTAPFSYARAEAAMTEREYTRSVGVRGEASR